ncbi:transcription elongation factor GreAB [Xylanibacillus composti]|uniref:Transcription elongation factor GreA/GreB C-terminal domain-containing protein n=1 Tax=Xylanibacillus composti TaxID=1572762 RepID=A0A8J4GYP6_9BACL|nr:GreA/GreB family elongation factor [Xylanibacillus composti]MDT9725559.1 transcription elongation factor GreAB [Xylanibacillus composti]GIQ67652.1 hypothetical protein XYCOK13_04760 [Xylanibacillus composti]
MNLSSSLEASRRQIRNQLDYFDQELISFLDHYIPQDAHRRSKVEQTLRVYTSVLEDLLENLTLSSLHSVVLIGSKIALYDMNDKTSEFFMIVLPHDADPDMNKISFLSPLGFQLLMARKGEAYNLETPSGIMRVRVDDIQLLHDEEMEL